MPYKPKSIAALHIALGRLPDRMQVEVDPDIGVSAKTVGELRKTADRLAGAFGNSDAAGSAPRKYSEGEQSERSNPLRAQIVGRTSISQRRTSENREPRAVAARGS